MAFVVGTFSRPCVKRLIDVCVFERSNSYGIDAVPIVQQPLRQAGWTTWGSTTVDDCQAILLQELTTKKQLFWFKRLAVKVRSQIQVLSASLKRRSYDSAVEFGWHVIQQKVRTSGSIRDSSAPSCVHSKDLNPFPANNTALRVCVPAGYLILIAMKEASNHASYRSGSENENLH
jgi:hypothetical protein